MGWRIREIKDEWQAFKPHLSRLWTALRTFDWRDWGHALVNVFVEFFRCFAYTLGHITIILLLVAVVLAILK